MTDIQSKTVTSGDATYGRHRLADFLLDQAVTHVNHGSYGAVPKSVLGFQENTRRDIERNGTGYFRRRLFAELAETRGTVARFLGGDTDDWVFVDNATTACNTVIAAQDLQAGDEVLFTSEIYGAVRKALHFWARSKGAILVEVPIDLPVVDGDQIVSRVAEHLTSRTKLAIFDHVSSPGAIVMPLRRLSALCKERGVPVLVDAAHATGMLALDVPSLGVDYYTGNGHKWLFAPKGCAFLWTDPERQDTLHPLVTSHGYGSGYVAEFQWMGTKDPTPWLSLPAAIEAFERFGGEGLQRRNRDLAIEAGRLLADELGTEIVCPTGMLGSMATVRLPLPFPGKFNRQHAQNDIGARYAVETSILPVNDGLGVRVSAQVYNELSDYERLLAALKDYFEL